MPALLIALINASDFDGCREKSMLEPASLHQHQMPEVLHLGRGYVNYDRDSNVFSASSVVQKQSCMVCIQKTIG